MLRKSLIALGFALGFASASGSAVAKVLYTAAEMQVLLANGLVVSSTDIRLGFRARITFAAGGELSGALTPAGGEAIPVSGSWKLKGNQLCRTLAPIHPDEICETWFKSGPNRALVRVDRKIVSINKW
jgi:hypothetical protein